MHMYFDAISVRNLGNLRLCKFCNFIYYKLQIKGYNVIISLAFMTLPVNHGESGLRKSTTKTWY